MLLLLQVFKFSPLGSSTKRLLALGDKLVPGSGSSRFCKPTSVAVDRSGEFFVADGYVRSENVVISRSLDRRLTLGLKPRLLRLQLILSSSGIIITITILHCSNEASTFAIIIVFFSQQLL